MNKNKIIFGVLGVIMILLIIWGVTILNKQTQDTTTPKTKITGDFSIWIVGDDKQKFEEVIKDFKSRNTSYTNAQIKVESFSSYEDYYNTLQAAFIAGKYPDVFVLNNNEEPIFLEQVEGINPAQLDANDFRKGFAQFFGDDLIKSTSVDTADGAKKVEFLIGVPVGYETLGVYYNRKFLQAKDVASWASINSAISTIKEEHEEVTPVGLGNGSTVPYAGDVITQFFMLDSLSSLKDTTGNKMKQGLDSYAILGEAEGDNALNKTFKSLQDDGKNVLDLFSTEEVAMVVGYPRMIGEINKRGVKKSFLGAAPFPNYFNSSGKTLVNYNYFVVNRNSRSIAMARDFVLYMGTEAGEKTYLKQYPYYLPAHIALETDFLTEKIHPEYNIILKDFLRDDSVRSSYNKGIKTLYDSLMVSVLDDPDEYQRLFIRAQNYILCQTTKVTKLENLSAACQ